MARRRVGRIPTALVAEGGGMRGIFTAGVLDVFLEHTFDPFDIYIGVSAGACNLSSHLARQHRRNFRVIAHLMTRPAFISRKKFLSGGHMMDLDYLWDAMREEEPLDVERIISRRKTFLIVATSVETGGPIYLEPTKEDCLICLKASSAVPLLYRGFVTLGGSRMVDGGVSDPIPAMEAYRRGARRIVVIRTRPPAYVKTKGFENYISSFATRRWPRLSRAILNQADTYRRCVGFILNPPPDAEIWQIAPPAPLKSTRMTRDKELLLADYETGRRAGEEFMKNLPPLK